jgi:chromosome partitioning protein
MTDVAQFGRIGDLGALVLGHAQELSDQLSAHRAKTFPPLSRKQFRRLTSADLVALLGVAESRIRQIAIDHSIGDATGARRTYSLEDLDALRRRLAAGARVPGRYLPTRTAGEHLQTLVTMNFKGGSGKTTTSAHLAQYLALRGYRVLALDLDPQASLSALFGVHSVVDVAPGRTIYGAIRYGGAPTSLSELIQPTYIPGLSLVPGGLELMEFEHEMPRALADPETGAAFFDRLAQAIRSVDQDFDVVIADCPPQLGYLTLSGLVAATSVLITVHPQMLDVMSMSQFLTMVGDLVTVIGDSLPPDMRPSYDWMRYLVTRYEPNDGPQTQMAGFLRTLFGPFVMTHPTLKSTAISDAGLTNQTIYEVERQQFTRQTYDRAIESVDAVNGEVESLIRKTWGRS